MIRRVLIVSPHFPPINAPDHQRVRMSLPYLREMGWEAHVLTVHPDEIEGVRDPWLEQTVTRDLDITRTRALPVKSTRKFGLGSLGWRSLPYLRQAGDRILRNEEIDLIYFSTTIFTAMALGARWRRKFKVPYVLDFQDPWRSDFYDQPEAPEPPGGRLKYRLGQMTARLLEPRALRSMTHTISVSPSYPRLLRRRYPWLREDQFTVLPFGAPEKDFELLARLDVPQSVFDPSDGNRHWVYVGRGGGDQNTALRALFRTVRRERERDPEKWQKLRLHFVGTSYAIDGLGIKTVEPVAAEEGIADIVSEHTDRIPYFEALKVLTESDGILLIGSDDAGYTASKIYPCVLARKPLLGIFHEASTAVDILRRCNAGRVVSFASGANPDDLLRDMKEGVEWLLARSKSYLPETDWEEFKPYTAHEMTRRQCGVFDSCLAER